MPSFAPGSVTPRMNRIKSMTYGYVAEKYTTWKKHEQFLLWQLMIFLDRIDVERKEGLCFRLSFWIYIFAMEKYAHFPHSYLSSPSYTLPDTEIDQNPGDSQCYCQWQSYLSWLLQTVGQLMHITSEGRKGGNSHCSRNVGPECITFRPRITQTVRIELI